MSTAKKKKIIKNDSCETLMQQGFPKTRKNLGSSAIQKKLFEIEKTAVKIISRLILQSTNTIKNVNNFYIKIF